jgi:deoxyribonuclease V
LILSTIKNGAKVQRQHKTKLSQARLVQEELRQKVEIVPLKGMPEYVAGVDVSARILEHSKEFAVCVVSLFKYPHLLPVEDQFALTELDFPYIPGFLSFREGPVIMEAISRLSIEPHVIIFDGQGIAHPMGLGIASHMGVLLNKSTIGCAKTRLFGTYQEPGMERGDWSYLMNGTKAIGAVLRTRKGVRPIFVSPGHLIDIKGALSVVMGTVKGFRIPEPIRRADQLSRKLLKSFIGKEMPVP